MKNNILLILLLTFAACQTDNNALVIDESQYQKFEVICDRDTTLISKKGVKINIKANTFECPKNEVVALKFVEIIDKSDMILNQLYTVDDKGQLLESGGMFQLIDATNNSKTFEHPIQLEIPTETANSKMIRYSAEMQDNLLVWSATEDKVQLNNVDNLTEGKKLFKDNCSACHNSSLRAHMTGPALGNVHLFREKDWLIEFTKNSQRLAATGDSIARCVLNWDASIMQNFPMLSDNEIENIYEYIANESQLQGIGIDEVDHTASCDTARLNNTFSFAEYTYLLELNTRNWVNVDYLMQFNSTIDPIEITLDKTYEDIEIAAVFQARDIVIPFVNYESDNKIYELLLSKGKEEINFPIGEKINIVAYSDIENFKYTILEYQPKKENNNINLSLESTDKNEFLEAIEKL